jgi:hypothetical protein
VDAEKYEAMNAQALQLEAQGKQEGSLRVIDAMLKLENLSDATQRKPLLERAAYLCIVMKDFKRASTYQSTLVSLCEKLYVLKPETTLPHPLLGFHYY